MYRKIILYNFLIFLAILFLSCNSIRQKRSDFAIAHDENKILKTTLSKESPHDSGLEEIALMQKEKEKAFKDSKPNNQVSPESTKETTQEMSRVYLGKTKVAGKSPLQEGLTTPPMSSPPPQESIKSDMKLYSVTMRDSDLRSVLLGFSKMSPYSIALDPNVIGKVSMDLKDLPLETALDEILNPMGYRYLKEGNVIRIYMPHRETRLFTLNYLTTVREGKTIMEAKSPGGLEGKDAQAAMITNKEIANVWGDIENGIKELLSQGGTYSINSLASTIVVTDYIENLEKIGDFLKIIEATIQRQILIEATIVEVLLSDNYQMGIDWTHIVGRNEPGIRIEKFAGIVQRTAYKIDSPVFAFYYRWSNIEALLMAMADQGKINVVSRPRITTLNNQKAVIKVGTEEAYFESTQQTGTAVSAGTTTYTTKFFTIGLVLDVTPQIGATDEITLHIHPVFSQKIEDRVSPAGGTVPIVSVRESSSVVKAKSGETVILGGLIMEKGDDKVGGVPVLMNLPLIGSLFQYTKKEKERSELVVALTPKIIYGKEMNELSAKELEKIFGLVEE